MHDLLFRNQARLGPADLHRYAERIGLDLARFESDLLDPAIATRVDRDVESGSAAGSMGRPACSSTAFGIAVPEMRPAWEER